MEITCKTSPVNVSLPRSNGFAKSRLRGLSEEFRPVPPHSGGVRKSLAIRPLFALIQFGIETFLEAHHEHSTGYTPRSETRS